MDSDRRRALSPPVPWPCDFPARVSTVEEVTASYYEVPRLSFLDALMVLICVGRYGSASTFSLQHRLRTAGNRSCPAATTYTGLWRSTARGQGSATGFADAPLSSIPCLEIAHTSVAKSEDSEGDPVGRIRGKQITAPSALPCLASLQHQSQASWQGRPATSRSFWLNTFRRRHGSLEPASSKAHHGSKLYPH